MRLPTRNPIFCVSCDFFWQLRIFVDFQDIHDPNDVERHVAASATVLVLLDHNYAQSKDCMRVLRAAVDRAKPLVCVVESNSNEETALFRDDFRSAQRLFEVWELPRRGPSALQMHAALFQLTPIEWEERSEQLNLPEAVLRKIVTQCMAIA